MDVEYAKRELTDLQKWAIIVFKEYTQMTERQIAELVDISQPSVSYIYKKWKNHDTVENFTTNNGRKSQIDEFKDQIEEELEKQKENLQRIFNAKDFQRLIGTNLGIDICESTSKRWLAKLGYTKGKIKVYQEVSQQTKDKRIKYATKYLNSRFHNWFFSDESAFSLSDSNFGVLYKEESEREVYQKQKQQSQSFIHVWGAISKQGKSNLYIFQEKVNSLSYMKCIDDFHPQAVDIFGKKKFYFVQDNARPHVSQITKAHMQNDLKLNLIDYPPTSPDFNPIEQVWSRMKKIFKIIVFEQNITKRIDGIRILEQIWEEHIDQEYINNCIDNLTYRLEIALENEGGIKIKCYSKLLFFIYKIKKIFVN